MVFSNKVSSELMMEIWILFYVISGGAAGVGPDPLTSGTIEFGSKAACESAARRIRSAEHSHKKYTNCIASGRYVTIPECDEESADKQE
jgi:hypothetical protein